MTLCNRSQLYLELSPCHVLVVVVGPVELDGVPHLAAVAGRAVPVVAVAVGPGGVDGVVAVAVGAAVGRGREPGVDGVVRVGGAEGVAGVVAVGKTLDCRETRAQIISIGAELLHNSWGRVLHNTVNRSVCKPKNTGCVDKKSTGYLKMFKKELQMHGDMHW